MPNYLISCASSDFSLVATWALSDPTAYLDSEAGSTEVATAPAWGRSASFAPGAITIDGIAVKLNSRLAAPAGTVSVRLYDVTGAAAVAGTTVTLNVSDLPTCDGTNLEGGWVLFKFAPAVLLLGGGNLYAVEAQESVATDNVLFLRNATASNWSRQLRTTTTQAPVAGDVLHIMGEHTGAGAGANITVTMDLVAATDFGTGVDASTALTVSKRGTLNYLFAAATNYYLKLSGNAIIYNGGTFTIGTVGSEIPRDSTAVLEFDPVADGGMGLICRNGSTVTMQGLSRTIGKDFVSCKLNTEEAIGQTELGVDTDTGWLAADEIGIASTTRTYSQCESRIIAAGGADVAHIDVTAGLTYAHSGTAPTQAEIILLTRNVKVRSATSTRMTYFSVKLTATVNIDWVEFYYLGENAVGKRGIEIETTTGSFNVQYSSLHDFEDYGINVQGSSSNNYIISYNVGYNLSSASSSPAFVNVSTSGTNWTLNGNIILLVPGGVAGHGFYLSALGGTITNNTIAGAAGNGFYLVSEGVLGTWSGNTIHSCNNTGFNMSIISRSTITTLTVWRCNFYGLSLSSGSCNLVFDTLVLFGNSFANIIFATGGNIKFINASVNGDASFPTAYGIRYASAFLTPDIILENCSFGAITAHTTADIIIASYSYVTMTLINTLLNSGTEIAGVSAMLPGSYIKFQKYDQIAPPNTVHKTLFVYGEVMIDRTYFHTAAPSERLTPTHATYKLESGSKKREVDNGNTRTFSVWVRKSSIGAGGFDYNGNQPRLVLKKNVAAGVAADVLLDTMVVGLNIWEQLTGVTPAVTDDAVLECVVDCDGTGGGFVNTDDWSAV